MLVFVMISCGACALILVFITCELGHKMSDAFEQIELAIDQWDWYLFSIDSQRMLPIIITIAHQPVSLECYGSITCSRGVFQIVSPEKISNSQKKLLFLLIECSIVDILFPFRSFIVHIRVLWCCAILESECSSARLKGSDYFVIKF